MNKKLLYITLIILAVIATTFYFVFKSQNKIDLSTPESVETAIEDVNYEIDEIVVEETEVSIILDEMENLDFNLSTSEEVEIATEDVKEEIVEIENEEIEAEQMLGEFEDLSF